MTDFETVASDYYRQQQHQPGWCDLFSVVVEGMFANASEPESLAFLRQMGEQLAQRYPLAAATTVAVLERDINLLLARFHWGRVDIQPAGAALIITHLALPPGDGVMAAARWHSVLTAIFQGLYSGWLQAQGGDPTMTVTPQATERNDMLCFRYQR
ncbi:cellulose synthase [Erwinia sp. OLTSP20]|uniref:cellulose biosynthesis protein BcsD n=1 Tax=unclassified Erwinia TaxID=2622719 RepID=UPI000C19139D|nr:MULTISPECIES: cellulose biosynthesis protein BcsD [unclassified Erwinia]PIJ50747.1 cellulose synthase [Erwinia sp. OAMSP11]PIJ75416.1 cellulose synthase [Erwinia sp. OLSSP12]PIJ81914.1 cellulose synthase [Erwinia sp. OLCASP19]PIJ84569.1 cellulose synthase [Erwinia sp. OLMTSP26]PIJ86916.1 cellulose synthase [Erwinia sp. OLMDSP33]